MVIEIDQSNKIEQTNKDTIIGMSNGKAFTVVIKKQDKRRLKEEFRKRGKPGIFNFRTFIVGAVLALKYADLNNVHKVIIDREYYGKEIILKSMFLEVYSMYFDKIPEIRFESIGRKSNAHIVGYNTMRGKIKPNKVIKYDELARLCLK